MPSTIEDRFGQGQSTAAAVKLPCKVAITDASYTLSGEVTYSGTALVENDRVLRAPASAHVDAGIWIVSTGAWSRSKDWDGARDVVKGTMVLVAPNTEAEEFWIVQTDNPIYPGTTAVLLEQHTPEELALRADLASTASASVGAGLEGFLPTLAYAADTTGGFLYRAYGRTSVEISAGVTPTNYYYPFGVVERYGAAGDGSTDDSAAFATAFSLATIGTQPGYVKTMPGKTYSVSDLVINGPTNNNNSRGEYSLTFDFTGSVLKGAAAATWILRVGQDTGTTTWANGVKLICGTLDMADMSDVSTNYGLDFRNAYNLKIIDPVVMGEGANKIGINFRDRAYTARIENPSCLRLKSVGNILASDAVTTLTVVVPDIGQLILDKTSSVSVFGGAIQNATASKVVLSNVYNINFFGVDVEGTSGAAYDLTGGNCSYVRVYAGNVTSGLTYVTGTGTACLFDDRDRGAYAVAYGKAVQNIPTTSATTIFSFLGDTLDGDGYPAGMSLVMVSGDDGANGFMDLVMCAYQTTYTAVSRTMYGSPPARTYTFSGANLQLALFSVAANNVRVALLSNPT